MRGVFYCCRYLIPGNTQKFRQIVIAEDDVSACEKVERHIAARGGVICDFEEMPEDRLRALLGNYQISDSLLPDDRATWVSEIERRAASVVRTRERIQLGGTYKGYAAELRERDGFVRE